MKKKAVISLLISLTLISILTFGIYTFLKNFKEDKQLTQEKIGEIVKNFNKFNTSVQKFAEGRDYLYNQKENTYLEEFAQNTEAWNAIIKAHQKHIEEIENNSKDLKKDCKAKFADPNINSKCTIFKSTYEAANNYYISDIKAYNKTVEEYNKWAKENNKPTLNKGKLTTHKDYIDYDNDKEYFGKEEIND